MGVAEMKGHLQLPTGGFHGAVCQSHSGEGDSRLWECGDIGGPCRAPGHAVGREGGGKSLGGKGEVMHRSGRRICWIAIYEKELRKITLEREVGTKFWGGGVVSWTIFN